MEKLKFADGSSGPTNAITEHHFRNIAEKKAVKNKDGSLSTVKTRIVEIDGVETLIPTIWDGKERSIQESIKRAKESGKNYPKASPTKEGREALQKLDNAIHVEMKPISAEKAKEILENRFDPQGEGYDFETADKFNIKPDKSGHYQSRVPETGMILKGKNHPTFHKTVKADEKLGYRIVQGTDGRYYSFKKPLARAEGGVALQEQMATALPEKKDFGRNAQNILAEIKQREQDAESRIKADKNPVRQGLYQKALGSGMNHRDAEMAVMLPEWSPAGAVTLGIDAYQDFKEGDYIGAGVNATAAALTAAGFGMAAKPLIKGAKTGLKRLDVDPNAVGSNLGNVRLKSAMLDKRTKVNQELSTLEATGLTDEAIELWRSNPKNQTPELLKKALKSRDEKLSKKALELQQGKASVEEYRELANKVRPVKKMEDVPIPATHKDMVMALASNKSKNGIIGLNRSIPENTLVDVRLDIPAYTEYDTWIPTITGGSADAKKVLKESAASTVYSPTVHLKNVSFIQPDDIKALENARNIATGRTNLVEGLGMAEGKAKIVGNKFPFATMSGEFIDTADDVAFKQAQKVFNNEEWTQVGYDPMKRGYFYSRETGDPILNAEEVIQVGGLVLAKNAKIGNAKDFKFNQGGMAMENQMEMAFMQEGGMQDDGGKVEPTSGNEVPSGSLEDEVKDDIPAMLSEGEFVFPADVVRFIGLSTLMKMRQDAKQGLGMMEKMGQLGNPEEAEIPDDVPFGMADLVVVSGEMKEEDKEEKAEGGVVGLQTGGLLNDPRFASQATSGTQPSEYTEKDKQEIREALKGTPTRGQVTLKKVVNPDNPEEFEMHPFDGDEPMFPIPEGYVLDDSPVEQQMDIRASGSGISTAQQDDSGSSSQTGGSQTGRFTEPVIDPFTGQPETRNRAETPVSTSDLAREDGKPYALYNSKGSPLKLNRAAYDNLVREYESLGGDTAFADKDGKNGFANYYNLPFTQKVTLNLGQSLSSMFPDTAYTNEQKQKLVADFKQGKIKAGNPLFGILSKAFRSITNATTSGIAKDAKFGMSKDEKTEYDKQKAADKIKEEAEEKIQKLFDTKEDKPFTNTDLAAWEENRKITSDAKFGTTPVDRFLTGTGRKASVATPDPRDPTGKTMIKKGDPLIRSTYTDPTTGKREQGDVALTGDIAKRIDDNVNLIRDRTQKAYSDPTKTTAERERDIHGGSTPSSDFWSGPAGGGSNEPGSGGATSGFGFGFNKGGLAKSKPKKKMKKGGLASKKKK